MWKKLILTFMLTSAFCMGLSITASAEEVEITPSDSISLGYFYQYGYPDQAYVTVDTFATIPSVPANRWYNGSQCLPTLKTIYNPDAQATAWPFSSSYGQYVTILESAGNNKTWQDSNVVWLRDQEITLNVTGYQAGYYRYEADLYVGCQFFPSFLSLASSDGYLDLTPSYTYASDPVTLGEVTTQYYGTVECINHLDGYYYRGTKSDLIHVGISWTFYTDGTEETKTTSFEMPFSILSYDFTEVKKIGNNTASTNFAMFINTRYASRLYSNVEPPITPTPVPTPYPGQDTQESINQGVQQIVQGLDVQATPIPYPTEIEISPSDLESLEELTLPDISSTQQTFTDVWDIFTPVVGFLTIMTGSMLAVGVFIWILSGRWL